MKEKKKYSSCGLIMPISKIDGCDEKHWSNVKDIIGEALSDIFDEIRLVSDYSKGGVIQKSIVQAIYSDDLVICDVSCKNPNVMFELGMRLAFDKPTLIIFDEVEVYPFDINNLKYLKYPRNLEYHKIKTFQNELRNMVHEILNNTKNTFLSTFGTFEKYEMKEAKVELDSETTLTLVKKIDNMEIIVNRLSEKFDNENSLEESKISHFSELRLNRILRKLFYDYQEKNLDMSFLEYVKKNRELVFEYCNGKIPLTYLIDRVNIFMKNRE